MSSAEPPFWRLPAGVSRGLWDYLHARHIAEEYDEFFASNRLFDFDSEVIWRSLRQAPPGALVADFGCGTGRALVPLVRRGFRGLAIDLSSFMLNTVQRKARQEQLRIACVRANLVELDGIQDGAADVGMCMFSTLGMIRGRPNRLSALGHIRRIIKPGGVFILHVHNYWYNLYDPGGPWWLLGNLVRALVRRDVEVGDKFFTYRGVPNMFLHVFRQSELVADLRRSGFAIAEWIPLDRRRFRSLRLRWAAPRLRANGWIVVCR